MLLATWIGIIIAFLAGTAGVIVGLRGQLHAQQANKLAAQANRHAQTALTNADEANRIAQAANELSHEANTIARTKAAKESENTYVKWAVQWDDGTEVLRIRNTGRDTANHVTVIVGGNVLHDLRNLDEPAPPGHEITLALPQALNLRHECPDDVIGGWWDDLTIIVIWKTRLGNPGQQRLELRVN